MHVNINKLLNSNVKIIRINNMKDKIKMFIQLK